MTTKKPKKTRRSSGSGWLKSAAKFGPAETITCRCGSVYERRTQRLPVKDHDYRDCEVCGERLESWRSTHVPAHRLVSRP
jgi:hypothetical protein